MTRASPSPTSAPTHPVDLDRARQRIDSVLEEFLRGKENAAAELKLPTDAPRSLRNFLAAGGKRLRPLMCILGWHAAGGYTPASGTVIRVAAALEMFHAFALVHDDIMDDSDTRRGQPTVHRALSLQYAARRPQSAAERLGTSAAIVVGDFALAWSDELIHTAEVPRTRRTSLLAALHAMRDEVLLGQLLDLTATGQPSADLDRALAIAHFKTAKYTIERPLHICAILAGADGALLDTLTAYALPLGEAFQLRDDLLGVFGDPARTGKSRLDDLREGKHTALIAHALRDAVPAHASTLRRLVGRADLTEADAARIRAILTATGARTHVEHMIVQRRDSVLALLDTCASLSPEAVPLLRWLADSSTRRSR